MPDWKRLVRKRTRALTLSKAAKEQAITELSDHLEEVYERARQQGLTERASLKLALQEVGDWRLLTMDIERTKSEVNFMNRTRSLLIPAFVNLVLSSAVINLCGWLGWLDLRVFRADRTSLGLQPWLLVLPICGATAAALAKRHGASSSERVFAAVAPAGVWLATLFVLKMIFVCFPNVFAGLSLRSLAFSTIGWFVLPAVALFVGAMPFLETRLPKPACE